MSLISCPTSFLSYSDRIVPRFYDIGTLKHVQIAAIERNWQVIARVKAGMDVSCP